MLKFDTEAEITYLKIKVELKQKPITNFIYLMDDFKLKNNNTKERVF